VNPPAEKKNRRVIFLLSGVAVFLLLLILNPLGVSDASNKTLAVAALMILWWVLEVLPMPVVALLPVILFPLLKIATLDETVKPYADKIIFLFMGGFMLGLAIEKWNLHRRIALNIVRLTGTSGNRIVLGFILATGLLSMWLSNTATTMMMFPIALSVIHVMSEKNYSNGSIKNFSAALMLCIAYASNIGGISTIIGTPPNVAYVGYIENTYKTNIDFIDWMLLCTPLALVLLLCLHVVLVRIVFPNHIKSDTATHRLIKEELKKLDRFSVNEKRVLVIFLCTALLWITKDIINNLQSVLKLDDTIIAITGAAVLFICPAHDSENKFILEWKDTRNMAWGILLLFGGGLTLAAALERAGLIEQLGQWLAQFSGNRFALVLTVTFSSLFISEVMSNIAQVIVFTPVVSSLADAIYLNPLLLGIPMTLAASCASMLPMGTPPNAIVFSSGKIELRQMLKAGLIMNIISVILITLFGWFVLPVVFGILN
jgi:sodium-dependent dicarboxylate transporter 2/3/5